jgi:hypothetical protein
MLSIRVLPVIALALVGTPALARAQLPSVQPRQPDRVFQPQSSVDILLGRRSQLPNVADTLGARAARSTCPMVVARPDTTRLERMPRLNLDSVKTAPMPVVRGCVADTKQH